MIVKSLQVLATAILSLSPLLFAQKTPSSVTAACGDLELGMAVHLDKAQHGLSQPDAGKALVYFIQDKGIYGFAGDTKMGIDGTWVGANQKGSFFSVLVDPGEHHLCASTRVFPFTGIPVTLAHLVAEPGKTYFYRTNVIYWKDVPAYLNLEPVDSDEAKFLIESHPLATATVKK
jgi:hypothetical protein